MKKSGNLTIYLNFLSFFCLSLFRSIIIPKYPLLCLGLHNRRAAGKLQADVHDVRQGADLDTAEYSLLSELILSGRGRHGVDQGVGGGHEIHRVLSN